jgi:transcriptional regulator with XRE-family HTH domain
MAGMNSAIRITEADQVRHAVNDLRTMFGLTQRALAKDAGYYQGQLSSWLSGRTRPDVASVIRLANALGYDLALVPRVELDTDRRTA